MRDKLTKKRIRVNYCDMIVYLKLDKQFMLYIFQRNNNLSMRRQAYAFLMGRKVDINSVYYEMKSKGFHLDLNEKLLPVQEVHSIDDLSKIDEPCEFKDNTPDWIK